MSFLVPDACTLPAAAQPSRLAEFDALFASAVSEVHQGDPTHARWRLSGPAGLAATVRDLTARETGCCSFFVFTVAAEPTPDGEVVVLDVEVPAEHADVLASLVQRASTVAAGGARAGLPVVGKTHDGAGVGRDELRTGEVAERAGVNIQTLRYYERRGLLAEPGRSNGGHRLYPAGTVALLNVIKAAQRLGFTLDQVAELLDAGRHRHPSVDLRQRAIDKIAEIDRKITDLAAIRATLTEVVDARCDSLTNCTCTDCPIPYLTIGTARPAGESR